MGSAFGQPAFGANKTANPSSSVSNSNNSAFGAASNTPLTTTSPFGSLQQNASQNASSTSSAFGKPTFGAATNTQSPFGTIQNTSTSSGTGVSPFGTFGTNSNNKSPLVIYRAEQALVLRRLVLQPPKLTTTITWAVAHSERRIINLLLAEVLGHLWFCF